MFRHWVLETNSQRAVKSLTTDQQTKTTFSHSEKQKTQNKTKLPGFPPGLNLKHFKDEEVKEADFTRTDGSTEQFA